MLEKTKINEKEAEVGPFKKIARRDELDVVAMLCLIKALQLQPKI